MSAEREGLRKDVIRHVRSAAWEARAARDEAEEAVAIESWADRILALFNSGERPEPVAWVNGDHLDAMMEKYGHPPPPMGHEVDDFDEEAKILGSYSYGCTRLRRDGHHDRPLYASPVGVRAPGAGLREELVTAWNEAARWRDFDKACFEGELAQQIAPIVDRIVREDAGRAPESERETYRNPEPCQRHEIAGCVACDDRICRGSEALGTACGRCSKCRARLRAPVGSEPEEE
jgi:hypothetical protein